MQHKMQQLLVSLQPLVFEFEDESHLHIGHTHNQGGGHYRIIIVSEAFKECSRIQRQRLVQDKLAPLFADGKIHALSITARTPDEFFN